jgi:glycosyltransferase involved in cell wall biosynthesis
MTDAPDAMRPRIAVVMCTYNGERFVFEQIASVLEQSRPPDQLVIVDDASTDATWSILQRGCAAATASGIDVILRRNEANLGYVANFDRALALADADVLFLCDQDDIWHPHKIERMAQEFIRRPDLTLLHTDARLVDATGASLNCGLFEALEITPEELAQEHAGHAFEVLLRRNVVTGATTAVRREAIRLASPFPPYWVHDEWIAMSCAMSGVVDCLEEPLVDYRQHGNNQIGVRKRGVRERLRPGVSRRALMKNIEQRLETILGMIGRPGYGVHPMYEAALNDRLRHAHVRANLPGRWRSRARKVLSEAWMGGYTRYSFGLRSIIADLLGLE